MSQQSPTNSSSSLIPDSLARMLQQHLHNNNQNSSQPTSVIEATPHYKAFVCEICGKAFRFRSNLAEHRSVHTAVKPFVCKFCGKSSRLKGNLTKHILKHHKTEQREHIGTDEYIIKKGKKSVKDPAAIEFLEQSMIVLNNKGGTKTNQQMGTEEGQHQNGHDDSPADGGVHNTLLSSLGLDASNMDFQMKEKESISDGGDESGGRMMDFDGFSTNNNNERLLENCENAIEMDGSEEGEEEGDEERSSQQCSSEQTPQQQQIGTSFGGGDPNALAAAACKAIFGQFEAKHLMAKAMLGMGMMKGESTNQQQQKNGEQGNANEEMLKLLVAFGNGQSKQIEGEEAHKWDEEKQQTQQQQQLVMPNASGGFRLAATQCQFCAKHFRKPRDLIAHLSNAHKALANNNINNNANIACPSPSSSAHPDEDFDTTQKRGGNENGNEGSQNEILLQELQELREQLTGMRQQAGIAKVEQMIGQLDSRVCRLEKQLEMVLNSIYTLVQLQTGINNSVNKLSRSVLK